MLVPVTGYILPVCVTQALLIGSVWTCGFNLFLKCVISQELMIECTYTVNLWSVYYMFFYDGTWCQLHPWEKLHPVPTAMLIVTIISGHIQYLRHTVSIGNRFPWLCIVSVSLIPVSHHRICDFPVMVVKRRGRGEGGLHVSKERGMRKERGSDTPFRTMISFQLTIFIMKDVKLLNSVYFFLPLDF